ncbi:MULTISPECIES: DUF5995 family protein [Streptomyces]|uniref:DUF5995 family protein n=1 Tax=Streptomyces TaxID=1883 RepID=UPI0004C62516|nr:MULTISPECIES: DUF5995 family protein [Streptomyces]MDX2916437.1 DUF5995 family protein [Streptomyces sp. NE06-03C]MDX3608811.1 DUF5995 family protein [Streptomyces sp. FL06-04B]MDX3738144.1 DUF5995 family protein [Streptomyces sp. ID01-15D]
MTQIEQFPLPGPGGPPTGGSPVIERMRELRAGWPSGEGVAVFNTAYLRVVERMAPDLGPTDREAALLGVRCAERYLSAAETAAAGGRPPECWRPLLPCRRHPRVRPLQFALSGLQAHVGHDLVLAVVDTCHTLGCEPPDLEGEFECVGELLALLEERIHDDLMPGPDLLEIADPLTHLVSSWCLERAREAAWSAARTLWRLRGFPSLAEEFRQRTDAGAGLVGRLLLTPCR